MRHPVTSSKSVRDTVRKLHSPGDSRNRRLLTFLNMFEVGAAFAFLITTVSCAGLLKPTKPLDQHLDTNQKQKPASETYQQQLSEFEAQIRIFNTNAQRDPLQAEIDLLKSMPEKERSLISNPEYHDYLPILQLPSALSGRLPTPELESHQMAFSDSGFTEIPKAMMSIIEKREGEAKCIDDAIRTAGGKKQKEDPIVLMMQGLVHRDPDAEQHYLDLPAAERTRLRKVADENNFELVIKRMEELEPIRKPDTSK